MHINKITKKIKQLYLYLPVWLIVSAAILCMTVGIFIGNAINKSNDSVKPKQTIISDGNAESTEKPEIDKT